MNFVDSVGVRGAAVNLSDAWAREYREAGVVGPAPLLRPGSAVGRFALSEKDIQQQNRFNANTFARMSGTGKKPSLLRNRAFLTNPSNVQDWNTQNFNEREGWISERDKQLARDQLPLVNTTTLNPTDIPSAPLAIRDQGWGRDWLRQTAPALMDRSTQGALPDFDTAAGAEAPLDSAARDLTRAPVYRRDPYVIDPDRREEEADAQSRNLMLPQPPRQKPTFVMTQGHVSLSDGEDLTRARFEQQTERILKSNIASLGESVAVAPNADMTRKLQQTQRKTRQPSIVRQRRAEAQAGAGEVVQADALSRHAAQQVAATTSFPRPARTMSTGNFALHPNAYAGLGAE